MTETLASGSSEKMGDSGTTASGWRDGCETLKPKYFKPPMFLEGSGGNIKTPLVLITL